MHISSDYFLLYHGLLEVQTQSIKLNDSLKHEDFLELSALFLATHRKNFNKLFKLESFMEFAQTLASHPINHIDELYELQNTILLAMEDKLDHQGLLILEKAFLYLYDSQLLSNAQYHKLSTLFAVDALQDLPLNTTPNNTPSNQEDFLQQKEHYIHDIESLKELSPTPFFIDELNTIIHYIHHQVFSIGITGVMNAGKSTLLNALMGEEVLGSAVIPETANLSIVKYSTTPHAKVHFWEASEWENLVNTSHKVPSLQKFIAETQEAFGDDLKTYIASPEVQTEIDINDLDLYTSAAKSAFKCNLVKYVELGVKLDFLSDGIEIKAKHTYTATLSLI